MDLASIPATKYLAWTDSSVSREAAIWTCNTGPTEVAYSCGEEEMACGGGCGRRYKSIIYYQTCCDTSGNCYQDVTDVAFVFVGCGCASGPCIDPNKAKPEELVLLQLAE